jgi:hypothetical protein
MTTSQPGYHFTHPSQLNMFSTDIHNHYKGTVIIISMILYAYDSSKILLSYKKVSAISIMYSHGLFFTSVPAGLKV